MNKADWNLIRQALFAFVGSLLLGVGIGWLLLVGIPKILFK